MRVTNTMLTSRMLLNINKNMRQVDLLYNQMASSKKVNYPSDNPILASRAIKFRSMVTETEQYQRNVSQGLSWMELSDYAFTNTIDLLNSISELSISGASDQNAYDDRQKIASSINQYLDQLSAEMNVSYAGRYMFSGYRTDQPPTYTKDMPDDTFSIEQSFTGSDIETTKSFQADMPSQDVEILKLAYTNISTSSINVENFRYTVRQLDNANAYLPAADEIVIIPETGELVLGTDVADAIRGGTELKITYPKRGFEKGELNPRVYFTCVETNADGSTVAWNATPYDMDAHKIMIEVGMGTKIEINSLAKNTLTDKLYADLQSLVTLLNRIDVSDETALRQYYENEFINNFKLSNPGATTDEVNAALASESENISRQVFDALTAEKQTLNEIIQKKFSNMIDIVKKASSMVSTQQTEVGTRMGRLELVANRLVDDRLSYMKLLSDNEDADVVEVSYLLNEATAVYQASLQAGANVIQLTLANFIR